MRLHLICGSCGEVVLILIEEPGDIPQCPRCGRRLAVTLSSNGEPIGHLSGIDDTVVSWLSQPQDSSERVTASDGICQSCGYAGMIRGDAVCPVCGSVNTAQTPPAPPTVDCPNCGRAIELLAADRGKTTICPGCKYFLGCVVPAAPRRSRRLFSKG